MWPFSKTAGEGVNGTVAPVSEFKEAIDRDTERRRKLRAASEEAREKAVDRADETLTALELSTADLKKTAEQGGSCMEEEPVEEETPEEVATD